MDLTRRMLKELMAELTPCFLDQGREITPQVRKNPYGIEVELDGSGVFGVWTEDSDILHGDLDGQHYHANTVAEAKARTIEVAKMVIKSGRSSRV
jgi:hypothetical protein